ncbi:MAG: hypothetical protein VKL39_16920 [Leptolyngbyaceae bacterium]|nr:hypothetical protein [Leptolyngbyaceae bacterium]
MPSSQTNRNLPAPTLRQDVDSFNGLSYVKDYMSNRPDASREVLQNAYQTMIAQQQAEIEQQAAYKAAVDAKRQAEWDFHKAVLAMKEVVRGQFGSDSNEAQAVGLKKKSERKRPSRRAAIASA